MYEELMVLRNDTLKKRRDELDAELQRRSAFLQDAEKLLAEDFASLESRKDAKVVFECPTYVARCIANDVPTTLSVFNRYRRFDSKMLSEAAQTIARKLQCRLTIEYCSGFEVASMIFTLDLTAESYVFEKKRSSFWASLSDAEKVGLCPTLEEQMSAF